MYALRTRWTVGRKSGTAKWKKESCSLCSAALFFVQHSSERIDLQLHSQCREPTNETTAVLIY